MFNILFVLYLVFNSAMGYIILAETDTFEDRCFFLPKNLRERTGMSVSNSILVSLLVIIAAPIYTIPVTVVAVLVKIFHVGGRK